MAIDRTGWVSSNCLLLLEDIYSLVYQWTETSTMDPRDDGPSPPGGSMVRSASVRSARGPFYRFCIRGRLIISWLSLSQRNASG